MPEDHPGLLCLRELILEGHYTMADAHMQQQMAARLVDERMARDVALTGKLVEVQPGDKFLVEKTVKKSDNTFERLQVLFWAVKIKRQKVAFFKTVIWPDRKNWRFMR